MRVSKNNISYKYDGDVLLEETGNGKVIWYYYGVDGIAAFKYNGVNYYYLKNVFGDITEIHDANGNTVAKYVYDAFGIRYRTQTETKTRMKIS